MAETYALIPPEGDPKVGEKVIEILGKVIQDKIALGLHLRWLRNHRLRRNLHWKAESQDGVPLVSANLLYTHTQRTVNVLTDNDPTFNVAGIGQIKDQEREQLTDLQRCTEHWWRDQEQQDVFESSVINGETYGITIEKVVFNPNLEYNLGEAETIVVDPFHFGWYPLKMSFIRDLQKCEAVLHYTATGVRQLRAKYPAKAKEIKSETELLQDLNDDVRREVAGEGGSKGSVMTAISTTVRELLNFTSGSKDDDEEETIQCEMWLRDKTQITEEIKEPDPNQPPVPPGFPAEPIMIKKKITRPKYTGEIRYILVCAGGVVLEDKDNPNVNKELPEDQARNTYLYDKYPFSAANSIKDTSNAWGISDYEQGEPLNMEINKALSQFVVEKDRSARKKFINPLDSGVPDEHITNYVGILKPTSAMVSQGMRWLETPPVSMDYEKAMGLFKDFFFLVMGSFELDQAQTGGRDVIAYKAIAALLERAATMMRGKIRSYSRLIRDRGRMYLSHVMNFYTEERWITYKDEAGKDAAKPIIGASLIMPAKLTVVSGSTMPISRVQQREEALSLYQQRAIDQTELLDKLDWSGRDGVVKRMMAGPLGQVFEKLMNLQMPQPMIDYIKSIAETDPKEVEKAIKSGELPPFNVFMEKLMADMQGQPQAEAPDPEVAAKVKEIESQITINIAKAEQTKAEVGHVMAEIALTKEQAVTERVKQTVALSGVEYDDQMLKIKRAEVVNNMKVEEKAHEADGIKTGLNFLSQKESELNAQKSEQRNLDASRESEDKNLAAGKESEAMAHKREMTKTGLNFISSKQKTETGAKVASEKLDRAGSPGYNESGMKSNNEEL